MPENLVLMADVAYRPLEYWSRMWARPDGTPLPLTTIRTWIRQGKCPAKRIGGQWMISQLELLNWTPPAGEDEEEKDGKSEGGGNIRDEAKRQPRAPRKDRKRPADSWAV